MLLVTWLNSYYNDLEFYNVNKLVLKMRLNWSKGWKKWNSNQRTSSQWYQVGTKITRVCCVFCLSEYNSIELYPWGGWENRVCRASQSDCIITIRVALITTNHNTDQSDGLLKCPAHTHTALQKLIRSRKHSHTLGEYTLSNTGR